VAIIGVGNKEYPYTEFDQQILLSYAQTFYSILSRKYAEEEYLKTLEIFNQAQQVGRIGAWRFDIVYNQTWWSDVMYDIYGLKSEDGIPENWLDFTHPDDRKPMEDAFNNALISGNYQCEYRLIRPNGLIRNIYAQAKVVFDEENKPKYYVGIAQDTTEITMVLEQLHAKN
jgi:PAS domain S-box-containing protein